MSMKVLLAAIFRKPLKVDGKEVKIYRTPSHTAPISFLENEEGSEDHIASKEELEAFSKIYKPANWFGPVHGVDADIAEGMGLRIAKLYRNTPSGTVEHAEQNFVWGTPPGTLYLFVKNST